MLVGHLLLPDSSTQSRIILVEKRGALLLDDLGLGLELESLTLLLRALLRDKPLARRRLKILLFVEVFDSLLVLVTFIEKPTQNFFA